MYICYKDDGVAKKLAGGAYPDLFDVYLFPADAVKEKPANKPVTIGLYHIDISYFEGANGDPIDADVAISPISAGAFIRYYSKYDINRDSAITLADVDLVRRHISPDPIPPGATEIHKRCDLNGDGFVKLDDLALMITAYEKVLP
jgi:hypothetical protein